MSRHIISIEKEAELEKASELMKKNNIGFLLVREEENVVGVITDRDIALNIDKTITGILSSPVITINKNKSLEEALKIMGDHEIKRLLVSDNNQVIGIISLSDILHHFDNTELILETLKKIFKYENNKKEENVEVDTFYL